MTEGAADVGAVVTAGLVAGEIEREKGAHGAHGHAGAHGACANCGTRLTGEFCHACGQHGHVHRTVSAILHDIGHGVFHFEGKVWRTLPMLVLRPGELTRRYIAGERVRFVSPMALFLFSVFLMFASIGLVAPHMNLGEMNRGVQQAGRELDLQHKAVVERLAELRKDQAEAIAKGNADADDLQEYRDDIARAVTQERELARARAAIHVPEDVQGNRVNTGSTLLNAKIEHAMENPDLTLYKLKSAAYKYSWALIPISLPFIWLVFPFRRDVGFYDHAVFATYSLAFMTLLVVVGSVAAWAGVGAGTVWGTLIFVPPIHMLLQVKGAYRLGWLNAVWRTAWLLFFTVFTMLLFAALLLYLGLA